ncbi:hypothetical protein PRIPAC_74979, partial [Pristionchus pacificus]|uniref:DDE_3 domain-containing protein n=1 Tax=Pristionchus pacificus TaxID=54126 RepID=A0A2A6CTA1_PRIPA
FFICKENVFCNITSHSNFEISLWTDSAPLISTRTTCMRKSSVDVDKLSVTLWCTNLFAYIADPLLVVAMLVTPEVTPAEKPVSRDDIISIIRDETLDLRKEVADNKNRIENVERRINSNYVKMVNLCTKGITPKCDWLRSIIKLLADIGILKEEETEAHIKVSDTLKRKLVNPTADVRKKFEDLSIKTGKGKSEAIRCYAKLDAIHPAPKHVPKLLVWGGISVRGPCPIMILRGKESIVDRQPSFSKTGHLHTQKIQVEDWPPESPDLNPIETVWAILKRWLTSTWKPQNLNDLEEGIQHWWNNCLTQELCVRLVERMQKKMKQIVARQGRPCPD